MATQNITVTKTGGFYSASELKLDALTSITKTAELSAGISGAGDFFYAVIDIPADATGSYTLTFKAGDYNKGGKDKTVALTAEKLNVVPFTSLEVKKQDGTVEMKLVTDNVLGLAALGVSAGILAHNAVQNH